MQQSRNIPSILLSQQERVGATLRSNIFIHTLVKQDTCRKLLHTRVQLSNVRVLQKSEPIVFAVYVHQVKASGQHLQATSLTCIAFYIHARGSFVKRHGVDMLKIKKAYCVYTSQFGIDCPRQNNLRVGHMNAVRLPEECVPVQLVGFIVG